MKKIDLNLFYSKRDMLLFILFSKIVDHGITWVDKKELINEFKEKSGLSLLESEMEVVVLLDDYLWGDFCDTKIDSCYIELYHSEKTDIIYMFHKFRVFLVNKFYNLIR